MKIKTILTIYSLMVVMSTTLAQSQLNKESQRITNYADAGNWSILDTKTQHPIDVFFVHPTTYGPPSNGNYIADLNDQKLNNLTDTGIIYRMTSAFAENCNIFAPRYRQVNIEVLGFAEKEQAPYISIPVSDIKAALIYYLKNLNNERPFILASHSQGSYVLQQILINNPEILNKAQLVAAYMPGWTFTDNDLLNMGLKLSETPDQVGGVIVWNTIGRGGSSPTLNPGARCVNPLSWTTDTNNYPASMNKEAVILFNDGVEERIPNFTSAFINKAGGLEIPTPKDEIYNRLNMSMGPACYHRYDYDFFFQNISDNVALRCKAYQKKHPDRFKHPR